MPSEAVYFQAEIGECHEFLLSGKKQTISIVISPLKVTNEEGNMRVSHGCNMWKACENTHCQFSEKSFPKRK